MGLAEILKIILAVAAALPDLIKLVQKVIDALKGTDAMRSGTDWQKREAVHAAVTQMAKDEGQCSSSNLINLAIDLALEKGKDRSALMAECGKGPLQADAGRFDK